jgi:hypothetical protein
VTAFTAGFVLLSLMPALPALVQSLGPLPSADQVGDALLAGSAGLCGVLLLVVIRRRRQVTRQAAAAFDRALARQPVARHLPVPVASGPATPGSRRTPAAPTRPESILETKIRGAARKGERVAAIARRHGMSIDAIRTALGEHRSAPAIQPGSSFRTRQQRLPAQPQARALLKGRTPYGAVS